MCTLNLVCIMFLLSRAEYFIHCLMMANCILDRNVTNIFVFTATCKFLSRISLRKLSGESLLIFRKSEKMCKANVKLKADLAYLEYCL